MKSAILTITLFTCILFTLFSCSKDNDIFDESNQKTAISFAAVLKDLVSDREAVKQQLANIPQCSADAPAFVEVVVTQDGESVAGTFLQPLRLVVRQDSQGVYFTEENEQLELVPGMYSLDYFRVLNANLEVIWIAPREEAGEVTFAGLVDSPLPLEIDLRAGTKKYVNVDVLCFDDRLVNYYGYLFFDLQANEAIKFCIFGNYCDENGRHIEAVSYVVSVWNYSGNEDAPKGESLYEDVQSAIMVEDDFENGTSVTHAVPLCFALPDRPGMDQYYFEITLAGGVGHIVPEELIRRGVISDDDIKSLYDGENVDAYHFREGNCNLEDSPALFEEVNSEDPVTTLFLPALQSEYGARGGNEWIHEYNQDGLLVKSMQYERFPYRLISEFHYREHNERGLPLKVDRTSYNRGTSSTAPIEFTYSSNNRINTITRFDRNGDFQFKLLITDFDDANRITGIDSFDENDIFINRQVQQFNSEGRIEIYRLYSSQTGTGEEDLITRSEFTYTAFGELDTVRQFTSGLERRTEYFYRANHTLAEYISQTIEEVPSIQITKFDENEDIIFRSETKGNHRTEYVSFFENGHFHIIHYYNNDFLYRIVTYNEDRSSTWKIIEEDFSYRIEYKNASGNTYKTEYYNSSGELINEGS